MTVSLATLYAMRDREKFLARASGVMPQSVRARSREYLEVFEELIAIREAAEIKKEPSTK